MSLKALRQIRGATVHVEDLSNLPWPDRRRLAHMKLQEHLFTFPWIWLGLTHERWVQTPFEQRIKLFG